MTPQSASRPQRRRSTVVVALTLALTAASVTTAPAAEPASPSASPGIAADGTASSRGTHCIECYLFWDPVADARAALDVPITVAGPAWLDLELTAADGTTVHLADLAGHPMLIELMATWCASCEQQQDAIRDARVDLPADTVIVSLDVDLGGDVTALSAYAADHGYDWVFATASRDLLRELAGAFGDDAINPAATPIIVVTRDGSASLPPLGRKSPTMIAELLTDA